MALVRKLAGAFSWGGNSVIPILYEATELNFTSNGVCRLAEATECHVTEERNGEYELTLTYPITGKYYDQIQEGMYIAATHDDKGDRQAFRIYRRSAPFNGLVQVFAHHISYALNNIILNPITATSAADAFDQMETDTVTTNPFTMWTDVTTAGNFKNETPSSIRSALGGKRGSILDVYGGEFEWKMFTVYLRAQRGINSGVTVRYGKNLTDLDQVVDAGSVYNAIVPFWFGTENDADVLVTLPEHYVAATGVTNPVMVAMDFSSEFQNKPEVADLRSAAASFLSSNQPWIPSENIKISFVQLWQTEEYKDVAVLQRLSLCDRVNVYYPAMGITAENVEIIKVVYNVLLDRYDSMELGDARSTFADTLIDPLALAIEEATRSIVSKSYVQAAINHATELITGGLGGNIVFLYDANGKFTDMLAMDTASVSTAQHVLRINVNGIGFSSTGINGPYTTAWTLDGQFVADFITAGTMMANRIKGGTLTLGGANDGYGVISVLGSSDTQLGKWDKNGISITSDNGLVNMLMSVVDGFKISDTATTSNYLRVLRSGYITDDSAANVGIYAETITTNWTKKLSFYTNGLTFRNEYTPDGAKNCYMRLGTGYNDGRFYVGFGPEVYTGNAYVMGFQMNPKLVASRSPNIKMWIHADNSTMGGKGIEINTSYFGCFGITKSRIVTTHDYGTRLLYSYETPAPLFGDVGEGILGDDGKCYVLIDNIFAETVTLSQYQVFLQKYGNGDCWISERNSSYFVVEGTPGLSFGWELKARQYDFDHRRLDDEELVKGVEITNLEDYAELLTTHVDNLRREREA